jgi:hypothetical protein
MEINTINFKRIVFNCNINNVQYIGCCIVDCFDLSHINKFTESDMAFEYIKKIISFINDIDDLDYQIYILCIGNDINYMDVSYTLSINFRINRISFLNLQIEGEDVILLKKNFNNKILKIVNLVAYNDNEFNQNNYIDDFINNNIIEIDNRNILIINVIYNLSIILNIKDVLLYKLLYMTYITLQLKKLKYENINLYRSSYPICETITISETDNNDINIYINIYDCVTNLKIGYYFQKMSYRNVILLDDCEYININDDYIKNYFNKIMSNINWNLLKDY